MRKAVSLLLIVTIMIGCAGCGTSAKKTVEKPKLTIAYQYSIGYVPVVAMKEQKLIEKYYDGDIDIEWTMLTSGSAINEGIISGDIDVGFMGVSPFLTGVRAGIPYKIFSGLSSQPYDLMTNQEDIVSLSDITNQDKIAVVSLGSAPHIMLAMASKEGLGDAHALDENIVSMSNADGMTALMSGAVNAQICIAPYNYMEMNQNGIHAVNIPDGAWPVGDTVLIGVASETLYNENSEIYKALCNAMDEAINFVNNNPKDAADYLKDEYDEESSVIMKWITDERSIFSSETQGVMRTQRFMRDEGFLDGDELSFGEIAFNNVQGD